MVEQAALLLITQLLVQLLIEQVEFAEALLAVIDGLQAVDDWCVLTLKVFHLLRENLRHHLHVEHLDGLDEGHLVL